MQTLRLTVRTHVLSKDSDLLLASARCKTGYFGPDASAAHQKHWKRQTLPYGMHNAAFLDEDACLHAKDLDLLLAPA